MIRAKTKWTSMTAQDRSGHIKYGLNLALFTFSKDNLERFLWRVSVELPETWNPDLPSAQVGNRDWSRALTEAWRLMDNDLLTLKKMALYWTDLQDMSFLKRVFFLFKNRKKSVLVGENVSTLPIDKTPEGE